MAVDPEAIDRSWETEEVGLLKAAPPQVALFLLYVGHDRALDYARRRDFLLAADGHVSRQSLRHLAAEQAEVGGRKYSLNAVLRFNVTVDPRDVLEFVEGEAHPPDAYLHTERHAQRRGVYFEETIGFLQDANALILVFQESPPAPSTKQLLKPGRALAPPSVKTAEANARLTRRHAPGPGRRTKRVKR